MKTQRPLAPLCLALGVVVGSCALGFLVKSYAVVMAIGVLYLPTIFLTLLVLPGETFTKGGNPGGVLTVYFILAVLQWYIIFAGATWLRRRLRKTEENR
jgi:hypothetical protein